MAEECKSQNLVLSEYLPEQGLFEQSLNNLITREWCPASVIVVRSEHRICGAGCDRCGTDSLTGAA